MVWFDCQCGESLKKPSVAKHFLSRPACQFLTCVDCNTAFSRDSYNAHTKCISEAQKYQGALYQASAKQEGAKQDKWLDNLTAVVSAYNGPLKAALTRMATFQNVPRKEKPFLAFCANSLGVRDTVKAKEIWTLIKPQSWTGSWEKELELILKSNGGRMHWRTLRDTGVARYREFHPQTGGCSDEVLKCTALASVKGEWLKDEASPFVSL